jgi:hypothetical protein
MPAFRIVADFHQFYLLDDQACPPYPEFISDIDVERRVKAVPNLIAVYALDDAEVAVDLEPRENAPQIDAAAWAHIVEASLDIPSGRIVIATTSSYLPKCPRVSVSPGSYRVRVAVACRTEGHRERYLISVWPGPAAPVAVIKSAVQLSGRGDR